MNTKLISQLILAILTSLLFIACGGQGDKKAETTDSASAAKTDSVKPATEPIASAVKAAPGLYKLLHDTLGIQMIEATYKPGDSSVLHSHADYAIYVIEGGTAEFSGKDGQKMTSEMKAGMENIRAAEVHTVKNIGKTTQRVLLVETTRPAGASTADASMDAAKIAGNLYKVKMDTLGLRILEATYKPGQSSALHGHPDLGMYVISGGSSEFTGKDGKAVKMEMPTGTSAIVPADVHKVKNVGKTIVKVLLVEVNRPR